MRIDSRTAEEAAVMNTAQAMCAAARTAPKARGVDELQTCILTGEDKNALAAEMERMGNETGAGFFLRDAGNIKESAAVVLIGSSYRQRGLNEICRLCNYADCGECSEQNGVCVYGPLDLGIALGSAVAAAADARVDNRILFSAGKAAVAMEVFDPEVKIVMAIPLCVKGKSPFFDRKAK